MSRIKEFNLPDLGEGLTEGEILAWLVKVGDTIELNQPIVEVETAKAAVEIPAKWGGVVSKIYVEAGTTVEVGAPIVAIDTDPAAGPLPADGPVPSAESLAAVEIAPAEGAVEPGLIGGPAPGGRTAVLVGYGPKSTTAKRRPRTTSVAQPAVVPPPAPVVPAAPPAPVAPPAPIARTSGPVLAKPPVRKLARDLGVDLATITGSGPLGSVTREDVHKAAAPAEVAAPVVTAASFDAGREQRIPVKGVRKLTAQNMVASAFTAPHVTEFLTVDVTRTMKTVEKLKERRDFRDVRISPLLLVAKAVLLAVKRHPMVNSSWSAETNEIVVKDYVNLGIAAATERGLIVPNVKDAGRLSLRELAEALTTLVQVAKSGKTPPSDMAGGTLSITNVGVFGVDTGTPILPPGESAILAFGAIRPMPWVHKDKIKIRQVTTLGLSFDHRIIDGELGSKFLRDVGDFLTDPEGTLLSWS
ncbi:dihydrolipoamide acetyltransferase component of pyruvate dehydrogenase complex [Paractinoplanes abujensis]|uniref:Dihydrolipoamide acetyltransferase component of pyruvate dehydrogenase complex n=1 Tax=Paractinoplanes abujensis TaxID=882441 RepID=A0A7W7CWN1_9ACTN|nr:dihydrolipoamide acetyltransferase family protein [Actinoplanes abujensis]MBB4696002.1 pyruvate dehydrogenase E2 component (dihydrolipoamide acetyltransferase) [Actinoplanes abujensis]GID21989.1 dihydrolipoamide acetyltransferase component of pyruvate dehydrogenase complex [Actinoplanes abujensis]